MRRRRNCDALENQKSTKPDRIFLNLMKCKLWDLPFYLSFFLTSLQTTLEWQIQSQASVGFYRFYCHGYWHKRTFQWHTICSNKRGKNFFHVSKQKNRMSLMKEKKKEIKYMSKLTMSLSLFFLEFASVHPIQSVYKAKKEGETRSLRSRLRF